MEMRYCRKCGGEINSDSQYCPKCGNPVNNEQSVRNENSFENNDTEESIWTLLVEFLKLVIELLKEAGIHIISIIDRAIQIEPNKPKDSKCPYCDSDDTFPIAKSEVEVKNRGYSLGNGCCGMCLLGPFGLLCGLCGSGSEVNSKTITWWGCKNCGKHHLSQHDAIEMLNSYMDRMITNCLCYGSIGSIFLYPILANFVPEFLRIILVFLIAAIVGVAVPLYLVYQLFTDMNKQLGYSVWEILDVKKKKEYWNSIKFSMLSLGVTLIIVCPILLSFAE